MRQFLFCADVDKDFFPGINEVKRYCREQNFSSVLFHLYCGLPDKEKIRNRVHQLMQDFPDATIAGVASNGEIRDSRLIEADILVSAIVFKSSTAKLYSFDKAESRVAQIGSKIREIADATEDICAVELLFPGAKMDSLSLLDQVAKCKSGISVFGGYPMGHDMDNDETFVVDAEGIDSHKVLALMYSGKELYINADKTAGWEKLGNPFTITKAYGHLLAEINHTPALDIYEKYLQITKAGDFTRDTVEFPLLIIDEGEEILRHAYSYSADGSIFLSGNAKTGEKLYFTYGNPSSIYEWVNQRCEEIREFEPEVIFLYSCAARKAFWQDDMVNKETEPFGKLASTAGFFTGGELIRKGTEGAVFEHNITMLSIAMREGKKKGLFLPAARVDDSITAGQSYLLKRLAQLVQSTNEELQRMNEQLRYMAITDELTGMFNRREIEHRINSALDHSGDVGNNVGLIMVDVDHFKKVNDLLGHDVGDYVLREIAAVLKSAVDSEKGEAAGRWGGEEFFVLLPGRNLEETSLFAEDLRAKVEAHQFQHLKRVTASFGVVCWHSGEHKNDLYIRVDEALYRAKEGGRNRVVAQ